MSYQGRWGYFFFRVRIFLLLPNNVVTGAKSYYMLKESVVTMKVWLKMLLAKSCVSNWHFEKLTPHQFNYMLAGD